MEHISFAKEITFIIYMFKTAKQIIGGVIRERHVVATAVNDSVLSRILIIRPVQFMLKVLNLFIRSIVVNVIKVSVPLNTLGVFWVRKL